MDGLIFALAPAFAVGVAMQAIIEWLDGPLFDWQWAVADFFNGWIEKPKARRNGTSAESTDDDTRKKRKKGIIRTITLVLGIIIAVSLDIGVLESFEAFDDVGILDNLIAGAVISMGTDGFNQIVKFLEKAKDNQETQSQQQPGQQAGGTGATD